MIFDKFGMDYLNNVNLFEIFGEEHPDLSFLIPECQEAGKRNVEIRRGQIRKFTLKFFGWIRRHVAKMVSFIKEVDVY